MRIKSKNNITVYKKGMLKIYTFQSLITKDILVVVMSSKSLRFESLLAITLIQGCPNPVLKSYYPATFRCIPAPTQLNQMAEFPSQYSVNSALQKPCNKSFI
ncbi:hypothetical protein ILYODFUR_033200 [Ilyodon furcidens]|uniref:Uncharacterized protein n=1 Tax=Ilyodon furcidens TaxID=33524 RepID=A0ABV0UQ22_9TELE